MCSTCKNSLCLGASRSPNDLKCGGFQRGWTRDLLSLSFAADHPHRSSGLRRCTLGRAEDLLNAESDVTFVYRVDRMHIWWAVIQGFGPGINSWSDASFQRSFLAQK
ncbi:hypothetical protein AVEN_108932-1 [Araneus ventricosus]|uniref:Uncharacterized protein n=1 Tax=Araneus ventricosus TaxID=182803 RepID=A0A4Y2ERT4_ARAVE|nr:hypothetical protein AVEN_108932-1 [Araneus ventricosus]